MTEFVAPERSLLRRELWAAREPLRLALHAKKLLDAPKGEGGVMVLPGYSTSDTAMSPLRTFLRGLDYRVWGWGLGVNRGQVESVLPSVIEQVEQQFDDNGGEPLALIGWSLGGVFAREVTRNRPDLVSRIITMATPIYGGPRYTVSANSYSEDELTEIDRRIAERNPDLLTHPITAFYTRRDGVLDWRTCIDDLHPQAENIEVDSSHLGITLDATVWLTIADRLANG